MSRKGNEKLYDYSSEAEISEEGSGRDTCYHGGYGKGSKCSVISL